MDLAAADPFLAPRDTGEERAASVVREFLLSAARPASVYRQHGSDGYALIVPADTGERLLTVPGLNEADFMFHGNAGTSAGTLADFIVATLEAAEADALRLPLMTRDQAQALSASLTARTRAWRFDVALASVAPFAHRPETGLVVPRSLRVALTRATRASLTIEVHHALPTEEIRVLHEARWGRNRGDSFFGMLRTLLEAGCAEIHTARTPDGGLAAAQVDILGTSTRHNYYSISDTSRAPRSGTAVLAASWRRFAESPTQQIYSFGRGAERYKYLYADRSRDCVELRGFHVPVTGS